MLVAFRNGLEYRNLDHSGKSVVISPYRIEMVRFGSITSEFKTYEVVRSAPRILPQLVQLRSLGSGALEHCGDQ